MHGTVYIYIINEFIHSLKQEYKDLSPQLEIEVVKNFLHHDVLKEFSGFFLNRRLPSVAHLAWKVFQDNEKQTHTK